MTADDKFAELEQLTGITAAEWADVLTLSPGDQLELLRGWKLLGRMNWAANRDVFGDVLAVLGVVGTIAGVIGGVASATSAVVALKTL